MPGRYDIQIIQGATFSLNLTINYNTSPKTPFVLTGWVPRGQVRRRHRATDVTKPFYFNITDAALGKITILMAAKDTGEIPAGETTTDNRSKYVWDFELENTTTFEVKRMLNGNVWINPEVTKP
jgi:hypothetical protein